MEWIDRIIVGLIDITDSNDIFAMLDYLGIHTEYLEDDHILLRNSEAFYIRNYNGIEKIFIKDSLPRAYEKFILAHELGHAILHTRLKEASYSGFLSSEKFEYEANYFAIKLLAIEKDIDPVYFDGFTAETLARALYINEDALECFDIGT